MQYSRYCIAGYRLVMSYACMFAIGITVFMLNLVSFGLLRRFNAEVISAYGCRIAMFLIGIKIVLPPRAQYPKEKVIYMFNHNSYLDVFIIPALGFPDTRTIISTQTKRIIPIYLANLGTGTYFIPRQHDKHARVEFLKEMSKKLRNQKNSILCSPEGQHTFTRQIAPFNRGVFHMAQAAGVPICLVFFDIPAESDPLESYFFKNGTVKVELMEIVQTKDWKVEELEARIREIKTKFEVRNGQIH